MDRRIRLISSLQYDWSEPMNVGRAFVYSVYNDAEIDTSWNFWGHPLLIKLTFI